MDVYRQAYENHESLVDFLPGQSRRRGNNVRVRQCAFGFSSGAHFKREGGKR
jgi:hypothetical protein